MNERSLLALLAVLPLIATANWFAPGQSPTPPPAPVGADQVTGKAQASVVAPMRKIRPLRTACQVLTDYLGSLDLAPKEEKKSSQISVFMEGDMTASSLLFIALNVYPFQPIGTMTNFATFLFIACAIIVVAAFYRMDRDPLLSRLSNTKAGELDAGFGWRLVQFGALPPITFLATHFPPIGQALAKFAQIIPGLAKL
jgi:hypothetical protein